MPPDSEPLSEKTRVSITLSSWWHIALVLAAIMFWGFQIKSAIDRGSEQSAQNHADILEIQKEVRTIQQDLVVFHTVYNDDMDRYIRDYGDKHRASPR